MQGEFNIKKIELMHHVYRLILLLGTTPQYSTDQSELLHIPMAKIPYKATNKKDYAPQICRFLDRREKICLFVLYIEWKKKNTPVQTPGASQARPASQLCLTASSVLPPTPQVPSTVSTEPSHLRKNPRPFVPFVKCFLPQPIHDHFKDELSYVPRNETTAFILTNRITNGNASIVAVSRSHRLPMLPSLLIDYYQRTTGLQDGVLPFRLIDCWDRVRLQSRCVYDDSIIMPPRVVMASAPSSEFPRGLCNFVLVNASAFSHLPNIIPCIAGMFYFDSVLKS